MGMLLQRQRNSLHHEHHRYYHLGSVPHRQSFKSSMHSLKPAYILPQPRASSRVSRGRARCQTTRRDVLRYTLAAVCSALLPRPTHAAEPESEATKWRPEDLCGSCFGRGKQTCSLCSGSGVFTVDDSVVIQDHVCPNCTGAGTVTCPTCIGLGLANTNGILRNGTCVNSHFQLFTLV